MKRFDLRVYVITACVPELGRTHEEVAATAIRGGATAIQFRDKRMSDEQFTETALRLVAITRAADVPLIVNDRVAIAMAVGADGVHIGLNDGNVHEVRKLIPADMVLGVSATNYIEALEMNATSADYLGVGPIFATVSKEDAAPALGIDELAKICSDVNKPSIAIGGINRYNLRRVIEAGAAGAAVISAVTHAPEMLAAVAELRRLWLGPSSAVDT
jgi:thiamine-phosphate pyrophosphorylase